MYEAYFGLSRRPFTSIAKVDHYFPGEAIEGARQALTRCIERAEGVGVVVGPSGTGKTLLCRMLAEQFKESFAVALLSSGRLSTRRALLQAILFELGQPYRDMDEGELRLALVNHLTLGEDCPRGMVLLVDEAHTLPLRLLDEIRMITNLVSGGEPRTRLVVAGGPLLEERFAHPKLESFSQRIVARCYLESFHREETQAYIHAALGAAGREGEDVISSDACHAVYQATDGVPRLVNQVCDYALLLACAAGREQIDRAVIEEAWADLQQLPTPWNGDSEEAAAEGGVIEFGGLDDEPEGIGIGAETVDREPQGEEESVGQEEGLPSLLRILPECDDSAGPIGQVERIERALSEVDENFEPAGSIGPELELVLDDVDDPFSEEFDEEEVIAGRCIPRAALGEEAACEDEACAEEEAHEEETLSPEEGEEPTGDEVSEGEGDAEAFQGPPALSEEAESLSGWSDAANDSHSASVTESVAETIAAEMESQEADRQWRGDVESVPMQRRNPVETVEAQKLAEADEGMIIVDEGYDDTEPVDTRRRPTVRRKEYGQLFASLRRGR